MICYSSAWVYWLSDDPEIDSDYKVLRTSFTQVDPAQVKDSMLDLLKTVHDGKVMPKHHLDV